MTSTRTRPDPVVPASAPAPEPDLPPSRPRLQLSATQVIASALAAVSATIAASYLGVTGTVVGAALASVVTVVGNAVYGHSIRRTHERVRTVVPATARWTAARAGAAPTTTQPPVRPEPEPRRRLRSWERVGIASAAVFVLLLAAITSVELVIGRPLSDALRGKQAQGTSLSNTTRDGAVPKAGPTPQTRTVTVTPSVVLRTPTVTRTAPPVTMTRTPTTTVTTTPSPVAPSSASGPGAVSSATPSGTPTP